MKSRPLVSVEGIDFYSIATQAKMMLKQPLSFNLGLYTPSEYRQMRCWAYRNGPRAAGYAIRAGDELVNVFSLVQGRGDEIVQHAIANGARRLDCYDGHLTDLYKRNGFVEVERMEWDDQYADPRWDKDLYGTPDVIMMELRK